jgi:hypothetical protein
MHLALAFTGLALAANTEINHEDGVYTLKIEETYDSPQPQEELPQDMMTRDFLQ